MTVARWIDSVNKGTMTVWGGPHVEAFRAQVSHGTAGLQIRSYLLACVYCHNCLIDTVIPRSAAILLAGRSLRLGAGDLLFFSVTRAVTTHTLSSLARFLRGGSAAPLRDTCGHHPHTVIPRALFARGICCSCSTLLFPLPYRQLPFPAFAIARNVIVAGAKLTRPARVASPASCGKLPFASSRSALLLSWTVVS